MNNNMHKPKSRKKATVALAIGGYANTLISILQGLILIPMYLHFLGAHSFGLWMASGGMLAMLGVLNFGAGTLLVQRVASAYGRQEFQKAVNYFINGLVVYLVIVASFILITIFIAYPLVHLLRAPPLEQGVLIDSIQLAAIATGLGMFNECLRGFSHALLRPVFSMLSLAVFRLFGIVATALFLTWGKGLLAIPIGMLITEVLILLLAVWQSLILLKELGARVMFRAEIVFEFFRVGGALFIAKIGHTLSRDADPLMITLFLNPEITAAYSVTRKSADIVFQIVGVLTGSIHSAFSHLAGEGNQERTGEIARQMVLGVFLISLLGFASYVALNKTFVGLWVGKEMALSQPLIFLVGFSFFLNALRNILMQLINGMGVFNFTSRVIFYEGLTRIILALILIRLIDIKGVPLSLLLTGCISLLLLGLKLSSIMPLQFTKTELLKATVLMLSLFGLADKVSQYFIQIQTWVLFALGTFFFLILVLAIYGFFYKEACRQLFRHQFPGRNE